jgi:hypothetical protein
MPAILEAVGLPACWLLVSMMTTPVCKQRTDSAPLTHVTCVSAAEDQTTAKLLLPVLPGGP